MRVCFDINNRRKNKNKNEIISINQIKQNKSQLDNESNNNSNECKSNDNSNEKIENDDVTLEELQEIYKYLLNRKKFLENEYDLKLNTQNNDNGEPKSLIGYQLMIDKLSKEVFELEKINNIWKNQNKNIQMRFYFEGQIYTINVDNETKLGDAFQKAMLNEIFKGERYTTTMNSETRFTDYYCKNSEIFNYKKLMFLLGGSNITENFWKNEPVSSLVKNSDSFLSIIVWIPSATKIMLKASFNNFN